MQIDVLEVDGEYYGTCAFYILLFQHYKFIAPVDILFLRKPVNLCVVCNQAFPVAIDMKPTSS